MMIDTHLSSRVWFITGSSRGLGKAIIEEVLASNERAVAACRQPKVLAELAAQYPPSQLLLVSLDVTVPDQVAEAFEQTVKHFGRLDVLVNCAGYGLDGDIEATPEEEARKQVEVLFWGAYRTSKAAIPIMRDINPPGQGGTVINISSCMGYKGFPTLAFYNVGKFALEGFTESFSQEMHPSWNIKGVIVQPGRLQTDWDDSLIRMPILPQYAESDSPSAVFRATGYTPKLSIGSPRNAAKAIIEVASMPDPPMRVQLGTDSHFIVRNQAWATIRDADRYANLAHSTNVAGTDTVAVEVAYALPEQKRPLVQKKAEVTRLSLL